MFRVSVALWSSADAVKHSAFKRNRKRTYDRPLLWYLDLHELKSFKKIIPPEICKHASGMRVNVIHNKEVALTFDGEYMKLDENDPVPDTEYFHDFKFSSGDATGYMNFLSSEESYFMFHIGTSIDEDGTCSLSFDPDPNWIIMFGNMGDRSKGICQDTIRELEPGLLFCLIKNQCGLATLLEKRMVEPHYMPRAIRSCLKIPLFVIMLKRFIKKRRILRRMKQRLLCEVQSTLRFVRGDSPRTRRRVSILRVRKGKIDRMIHIYKRFVKVSLSDSQVPALLSKFGGLLF